LLNVVGPSLDDLETSLHTIFHKHIENWGNPQLSYFESLTPTH